MDPVIWKVPPAADVARPLAAGKASRLAIMKAPPIALLPSSVTEPAGLPACANKEAAEEHKQVKNLSFSKMAFQSGTTMLEFHPGVNHFL
jgi:hypothetical protein